MTSATVMVIVSLALLVLKSAATVPCQPGDVVDEARGRCFLVFSQASATWTQALQACQKLGATLTKMDEQDLKFLVDGNHIQLSKYYWIGLNDFAKEGTWVWTDGTPVWVDGTAKAWVNWRRQQPNNEGTGGQQCGCLDSNQEWQDKACSDTYNFICERVEKRNPVYVRQTQLPERRQQSTGTESCLEDCVYRCDLTTDCFGVAYKPGISSQTNCVLYYLKSGTQPSPDPSWLFFDKVL